MKNKLLIIVTLIVGLSISILMFGLTVQGPGVTGDSVVYIGVARNILAGRGFFIKEEPMTHYPFFYPLLLAITGFFTHGDVLLAARLLSAIFYGLNLILLCLVVQHSTDYSWTATLCTILIFIFSTGVMIVHCMAWSEAPYIAFSIGGLFLLSRYIVRPKVSLLISGSILCCLAVSTRYVGIVLLPTIVFIFLLFNGRHFKQRMKAMIISLVIVSSPFILWIMRNILKAHTTVDRQFSFHPFNLMHLRELIISTYNFFMPFSLPDRGKIFPVVITVFFLFLMLKMLYKYHRSNNTLGVIIPSVFMIYSLLYIVFLIISISFLDATIPLSVRILLPVFLMVTAGGISVIRQVTQIFNYPWLWYGFVSFVIVSATVRAESVISKAKMIHNNGIGYVSSWWRNSDTLRYVSDIPEGIKIYSNSPEIIYFWTGKKAAKLPVKINPYILRENPEYHSQMARLIQECIKGNAVIVYFYLVNWRWYLPGRKEIDSLNKVTFALRFNDGVVYGNAVSYMK